VGRKYYNNNENQFQNEFLRALADENIYLIEYLNVNTSKMNSVTEVIDINKQGYSLATDHLLMNNIFDNLQQKKQFFSLFK